MNIIISLFIIAFTSFFWLFLVIRISSMKKEGIDPLTLSTRSKLKNNLGKILFLGILLLWNLILILSSFITLDSLIFLFFWHINNFYWLTFIGVVLAYVFQAIMWISIYTMGKSWRMGIDDKNPSGLITHGIYKYSRNPIFLGFDGILLSAFLIYPNLFFLSFALIVIIGIHFQILKEEKHLKKIYGNVYIDYANRTKRYILFF